MAEEYPLSLIRIGANLGSLRAHRKMLDEKAEDLFHSKSSVVVLEFDQDEGSAGMCLRKGHQLVADI